MRFSEPLYHRIQIDRRSGRSLHDQLVDELRRLIRGGALEPGTRVPSTRTLADALDVSRSVAQSAFLALQAEGLLESRPGSGSYVRRGPGEVAAAQPLPAGAQPRPAAAQPRPAGALAPPAPPWVDFSPAQPNLELFPRAAWRAAWRRACHQVPAGRQDPLGEPALRAAIANHLRGARGIRCQARQVLVCAGRRGALDTVAVLLAMDGGLVAVEDPGCQQVRRALLARGAGTVAAGVDGDGVRPETGDGRGGRARHLVACPSHQFPLGVRMPAGRRAEVLEWARARDGVVVEDDQYAELSDPGAPEPSLLATGTDLDRVAHIGSLGNLLTPTLQVDYVVLTDQLRRDWTPWLAEACSAPPWMAQQAALHLLADRHLPRQARLLRLAYRRKREIVRAELAPVAELAGATLTGLAAGTFACLLLPPGVPAAPLATALDLLGVRLPTVASCTAGGAPAGGYSGGGRDGLVIGYGHVPDTTLHRGLYVVAHQLHRHLAQRGRLVRAG